MKKTIVDKIQIHKNNLKKLPGITIIRKWFYVLGREWNRIVNTNTKVPAENRLTRDQLWELEEKEKSGRDKFIDRMIAFLPLFCCAVAVGEYLLIPDKYTNKNPERYLFLLLIPAAVYAVSLIRALFRYGNGDRRPYQKQRHKAPFLSALFLLLALFDYLTLKTGFLTQPFIPWINDIINIAIIDWKNLLKSTVFSLRLLFMGYFSGVAVGLVTGVACGYSEKVKYWVSPIIKVLGPIPTATWIPLIMILASSLFGGSVFIVALGTWFAVTTATMTGISNIEKIYYDAARTLGARGHQLVFRVAIPHAMPSILQGMTQGMSSACISLMIAEMMGVEAGLGWYITWAKAWAAYNKMFAAIVIICLMFNAVTMALDLVKRYALRWQTGGMK